MKKSLEFIATLSCCCFSVYSIVYKHLKQPDETKKESCVGIQLMGVVLSAKFPPYAPTAPVDQEK